MATQSPSASSTINQEQKSYHIIFNPISGQQEPGTKLMAIEQAFEGLNFKIHLTSPEVDACQLAEDALEAGADVLVAAGGDGTVTAVASVLMGTNTPLGIIPSGTANGFATALGLPENVPQACEIIKAGHRSWVDTARCNGQLMLLVACIGFEASLLDNMEREEKNLLGKFAIVKQGIEELKDIEKFDSEVVTPESSWHEPATAVTIANTATADMVLAQGPAEVAPNDSRLSVTLMSPEHQWEAVVSAADLLMSALQKRAVEDDTVRHCQVSEVTVETHPPKKIFVDGEPAGHTPLTVKSYPRSLAVFTPADQDR